MKHISILHLKISIFKGSVSRDLRWVLLYINRNLSLRPIIGSQKILSLLKGYFTIYIKQAGAPLFYDMVLSRQYLKAEVNVGLNIKFNIKY